MQENKFLEFTQLNEQQLANIDGGIFPIIIGGVLITKGAVVTGGIIGGAVAGGVYAGYKSR
ncbi:class IIb bacteriocin, lactobin A/cerein 7B family [Leuconostoc gelidum]|uniref:class IIb bacteriocin, lactobin A/cerein 7B family n=1 Tax=Leuconostoc gelidum TaxID=1244 RepID=UPI00021920E5|nr:class IIb bacteriocin, lactobin A/cerein 7B family [Leuconostoc gelidum]AFS39485.1 hypothetical protein C269_00190 [Leuconostoc gelidum JB7]MBZ5992191.1 class IIb bacteriocin, lactobin A/cerein 7B family [Leuconostoc gelidum subsp. gelidum]USP17342.1 class IIb bacteriocin, lactobin A/cerein 7B family [Leuconostoc gelidum subsp. aenigmaticum]GMA67277.1 hypothetical protein GCM10025884_09040 [Leuconostoc gelidum subsp. gelidum]